MNRKQPQSKSKTKGRSRKLTLKKETIQDLETSESQRNPRGGLMNPGASGVHCISKTCNANC